MNNEQFRPVNLLKILTITIFIFSIYINLNAQDNIYNENIVNDSTAIIIPEDWPEDWPIYHLLHPGKTISMPADPNAAFYYKGQYHLHYLYCSEEGGLAMAHVSSSDMVHWKFHPTVLRPKYLGHGVLSGTGFFTKEGQPAIIYGDNKNVLIIYAKDDNLDSWTKPQKVVAKDKKGVIVKSNVWDPDCWLDKGTYYSIGGGKSPDLKKSTDLKNWEYLGHLMHKDFPKTFGVTPDDDVSCPNMFKIGDKWMLLCISHALGCRYYIGDFKNGKYLPDSHALMNWEDVNLPNNDLLRSLGTFFAPESLLTPDGRRVMWAWLFPRGDNLQHGVQSLPRELELPKDNKLRIKPLRELEELRYDEKIESEINLNDQEQYLLKEISGDALELEIVFNPLGNTFKLKGYNRPSFGHVPQSYGIDVLCDENGKNGVRIAVYPARKTLNIAGVAAPLEIPIDKETVLRVFIDKGIIEVFANDCQAMAYAHKRTHKQANYFLFSNQGGMLVKKVTAWKMNSAWGKE